VILGFGDLVISLRAAPAALLKARAVARAKQNHSILKSPNHQIPWFQGDKD
jgi:hypothetical protein